MKTKLRSILFAFVAAIFSASGTFAQPVSKKSKLLPSRTFHVGEIELVLISIKGDIYTMGEKTSKIDAALCKKYGTPIPNIKHKVWLSDYSLGQTEVTQALWKAVMGYNNSPLKGDNLPVYGISWDECKVFIATLNALTGESFRLPTEAEWEYAARGGTLSKKYKYSGSNKLTKVAWSKNTPMPVATKGPNELGLFDMSGNVPEWCEDTYDDAFYYNGIFNSNNPLYIKENIVENPVNTDVNPYKVIRGGGESDSPYEYRVSSRDRCKNTNSQKRPIGFRLALSH